MAVDWTAEKIADLPLDQIKILRANCANKGADNIVVLCDAEILKRTPPRKVSSPKQERRSNNDTVVGYHFVCRPEEKGVTRNPDGTVWSGTWVVAARRAEKSLQAGAYVALHLSHAERSYMHGKMKGWRRSKREREYAEGQEVKTEEGTDFLLELTDEQVEWRGEGTVERSYVYASDEQTLTEITPTQSSPAASTSRHTLRD
jgi:hypothetical protein